MKGSCKLTPTVNVEGKQVKSKLFEDLVKRVDRESAVNLYAMTKLPVFIDENNIVDFDENGEVTIEILENLYGIDDSKNRGLDAAKSDKDNGFVNGSRRAVFTAGEAAEKIVQSDKKNNGFIGIPFKNKKGYSLKSQVKNRDNELEARQFVFNSKLNTKLVNIMRAWGFDIAVDKSLTAAGIFDPENAVITKDGLITVIRVKDGKIGMEAIPEEFSHMAVEGLHNNPLVQRLVGAITDTDAEEYLGDQYQTYYDKYAQDNPNLDDEGVRELVRKEVAGKYLHDAFQRQAKVKYPSLMQRIWNTIKNMIPSFASEQISNAVNEASQYADLIAETILSEKVNPSNVDTLKVLNSVRMYRLEKAVDRAKEAAEEAFQMKLRKLKLDADKSKTGLYDKDAANLTYKMQKEMSEEKYAQSCILFLGDATNEIKNLNERITRLKEEYETTSDIDKIANVASLLREMQSFLSVYIPIIEKMKHIGHDNTEGVDESQIATITKLSKEILDLCGDIAKDYRDLRGTLLMDFYRTLFGEDKIRTLGRTRGTEFTLESILKMADGDIGMLDRFINSMADASDPLLSLVDRAVKRQQMTRDEELVRVKAEISALEKELEDAGLDSEFMYERDENGIPTGLIISEIDHAKYMAAKQAVVKELKKKFKNYAKFKEELSKWEAVNERTVKIDGSDRTYTIPNPDIYSKRPGMTVKEIYHLNDLQYRYYQKMLELKKKCDSFLPASKTYLYRAPQRRNDSIDAAIESKGKGLFNTVAKSVKDKFVRRVDDFEFGSVDADFGIKTEKEKKINMNLQGDAILSTLPVFYTSMLEDMSRLSTDFSAGMMAYSGMAYDYAAMDKIVDVLELTRDLIDERKVKQYSGDSKLVDDLVVFSNRIKKELLKSGASSAIHDRFADYMESVVYKKRKRDEGTIGDTNIDVAKTLDTLKEYVTVVGLGLNVFSAISNVTMGNTQIFIESVGGEYFGMKDMLKARVQYEQMLPSYLGELGASSKTNKLALMIDKFNMLDEFFSSLKESYYKSATHRIFGGVNLLILNNLGEHTLHCRTALAVMNGKEVYRKKSDGTYERTKLFDAYTVEETKNEEGHYTGHVLKLKEPIYVKTAEGDYRLWTKDDEFKLKERIQGVNHLLHGAFNEEDRGAIHRYALGRLAMQFRQWMPKHYLRRFGSAYYNAQLEQEIEGYYRTFGRFVFNVMKELKQGEFKLVQNFHSLTAHEQANIKKSLTELAILGLLTLLIRALGPVKDKKGYWGQRMALYQAKRLKMEVGASTPSVKMLKDMSKLMKSPAAALNQVDRIIDVFNWHLLTEEVNTGRYKGWNKWEKNAIQLIPLYNQFSRVKDLTQEDYMFQIFNY